MENNEIEERVKIWKTLLKKKNLTLISYREFLNKEFVKNPLFLPSLFEEENVDWEIIKNRVHGEIYTECDNLFYYIGREMEIKEESLFVYKLNPLKDTVKVEIINLSRIEREYKIKKLFTPYGIKEFLKFRGFCVKELWGDYPFKKVIFNSRKLLIRMVQYGN